MNIVIVEDDPKILHAPEDNLPYPAAGTNEPCWRVLVAYGRKDAFEAEHLFDEHNHRKLNRAGEEELARVLSYFQHGQGDVAQGFLWTPVFKRLLDPSYTQTSADKPGPKTIYTRAMKTRLYRWLLDQL